jgi:hypothetical protein
MPSEPLRRGCVQRVRRLRPQPTRAAGVLH